MSGLAEEKRSFRARGGAVIAYRMHRAGGAGRTLVLIHGLASNMSRWSEFAAQTSLQSSWNILRIDLRGQGGSVFRGPAGMDEWCEDLAGIVDAEGVRSAVLAGHCLGANLALRFAAAHPGRVAGLVLIEPMPRRALTGVLRIAALIRPAILLLAWTVRGLNALGLYRRRLETVDLEALDRRARAALAAGAAGAAALRDYASPLADLRSMPLAAYLQGLAALLEPQPDLSGTGVPVLVLTAAHSRFTDAARARRLLDAIPGCEFRELPALHWIPTEAPFEMRAAIEDWGARRF